MRLWISTGRQTFGRGRTGLSIESLEESRRQRTGEAQPEAVFRCFFGTATRSTGLSVARTTTGQTQPATSEPHIPCTKRLAHGLGGFTEGKMAGISYNAVSDLLSDILLSVENKSSDEIKELIWLWLEEQPEKLEDKVFDKLNYPKV